MPILTGLNAIINSGMMQVAYRVLTTDIDWPTGDPPFAVGTYATLPAITGTDPVYAVGTFDPAVWTDCTALISDYVITQDSSMQIDAASLTVPVGWKSTLATVFREMRAIVIQERYSYTHTVSDGETPPTYSDEIVSTAWVNVFWGISDGYSESWSDSRHNYVVNIKDALKLANIEYLGTATGSVVYQPDTIKIGTNTTHYQMELVNTATDAFEYGICETPGDEDTGVHPNWADKPAPQFWCHNARDKDGNVSADPIPLAIGDSAVNAVFGEGLVRVGIQWARTTSENNDVTDYSQGLGLIGAEVPDIRCIVFRFAHPATVEGVTFRSPSPLTLLTDTVEGLHIESSSAGQVVLNAAVLTHGLTLLLNDGTGLRYNTKTSGSSTATINLTNSSVVVPVNTPVTYGDCNKLTTVIQRMLLDCGYQQTDNTAPLYITPPSIPTIAGSARDLILPPMVYKDEDRVYPIAAIENLRQSGYIPPNYYVRANTAGQIVSSSVEQLASGNANIIAVAAIPSSPGIEYDRNDLDVKTRVVARGLVRQVQDYTQIAGITIADWTTTGGLPSPSVSINGEALRTGGDTVEGDYQYNLTDLFARYQAPSIKGWDLRPWGWYYLYTGINMASAKANGLKLYEDWRNKILAVIELTESTMIQSLEIWTPCPWQTDTTEWGLSYHNTNVQSVTFVMGAPTFHNYITAHADPQTIAIEYYDAVQENWLPLINNLVCAVTMDSSAYIHRIDSKDFATRESVETSKLRIVCIEPFFAEHGFEDYHAVFGVWMSQLKIWGSEEIRGVAELGNAANYGGQLVDAPWPTVKKRIRKRTHILDEAVPWISTTLDAQWLAIEWLKQFVQDLAPRKLSAIRPDIKLWDTIQVTTPGGPAIDYLVTATDHKANGITGITAVSYTYPYFEEIPS